MSGPFLIESEITLASLGGEMVGVHIPVNGVRAILGLQLTTHEDGFYPPLAITGKLRLKEYHIPGPRTEFPKAPARDNVVPDRRF